MENESEFYLYTQGLADSLHRVRLRTLNMLKKHIKQRSNTKELSRFEMNIIWKGLFFCMYNADKSIVQENLADEISCMIHIFPTNVQKKLFFSVALATFCREWNCLDNFRLDKYFMLFTKVFRQCLVFLSKLQWKLSEVKEVASLVESNVFGDFDKLNIKPYGLKMHFVDVFLEELAKVGRSTLRSDVIKALLVPFIKVLALSNDTRLVRATRIRIFDALIEQSDVGLEDYEEKEDMDIEEGDKEVAMDPRAGGVNVVIPTLRPDFKSLTELVLAIGGLGEVTAKKRKILYDYVQKFKSLAEGAYPLDDVDLPEVGISTKPLAKKAKFSIKEDEEVEDGSEDEGDAFEETASEAISKLRFQLKRERRKKQWKKKKRPAVIPQKLRVEELNEHQKKKRQILQNINEITENINGIKPKKSKLKTKIGKPKSPSVESDGIKGKTGDADNAIGKKGVWKVLKLVSEPEDSNKVLDGKKKKVKKVDAKIDTSSSSSKPKVKKSGQSKPSEVTTSDSGKVVHQKEKIMKLVPKSEDANKVLQGKKKKIKRIGTKPEISSPKSNEILKNKRKRQRKGKVNKQAKNESNDEINSKQSLSQTSKPSFNVKNPSKSLPEEPKSKSDPWDEPLQDGEVEILIPNKKFAKKVPSSKSKLVIKKTPKKNTRGQTLRIDLNKNEEHDVLDYRRVLRSSPGIPFSAALKPKNSALKPSPNPTKKNPRKSKSLKRLRNKFNLVD